MKMEVKNIVVEIKRESNSTVAKASPLFHLQYSCWDEC